MRYRCSVGPSFEVCESSRRTWRRLDRGESGYEKLRVDIALDLNLCIIASNMVVSVSHLDGDLSFLRPQHDGYEDCIERAESEGIICIANFLRD